MSHVERYEPKAGDEAYCCESMDAIAVTQSISAVVPTMLYTTVLYQCTICSESRTVTRAFRTFLAEPDRQTPLNQR